MLIDQRIWNVSKYNILNFSGHKTAFLLREIVGKHDCSINEKVRVADVLHLEICNCNV